MRPRQKIVPNDREESFTEEDLDAFEENSPINTIGENSKNVPN